MTANGVNKLAYVPALDGLRGVAILLVVSFHYTAFPFGGGLGVDLFFVLSGFLITTILLEQPMTLRGFYARRARRLFPALAALLIGFGLLGGSVRLIAEGGFYTGNLVQAFDPSRQLTDSGIAHLWSLAGEEQFYLLWPLAVLALVRVRRPVVWVAGIVAVMVLYRVGLFALGASHTRLYLAPDTHSDGLLIGAALAYLRQRGSIRPSGRMMKIAMTLFLVAVAFRPAVAWWDAFGLVWFELAVAVLVAAAVTDTEIAQWLSWRPLVALGTISYSLYLWHYVLLFALWPHRLEALVLTVVFAVLSYRFIEQPFRRRRRRGPVPEPLPATG